MKFNRSPQLPSIELPLTVNMQDKVLCVESQCQPARQRQMPCPSLYSEILWRTMYSKCLLLLSICFLVQLVCGQSSCDKMFCAVIQDLNTIPSLRHTLVYCPVELAVNYRVV